MLPTSISKVLAAASANNISLSQSLAGAGNLLINGSAASGGVATLDAQRRVIITSAGNDSGLTWTVTGTDAHNTIITDTFAGGNVAAAQSNLDFKTVTKISGSGATAAAVTAGTNGVGSSYWHMISTMHSPVNASVAVQVTGAVNYTIQYTYDAFWNLPSGVTLPGIFNHNTLNALAVSADGVLPYPVSGVRLTVNSGTGTARMTVIDAGDLGP
jgi:hypothetical protein